MTLHYPFPIIEELDDILPVIEGCPEFVVVKKDTGITVINYVMVGESTFPPVGKYDEAARRECRGLIFDTESGQLIARRLHKFFNLGERPDTSEIDLARPHCILEKLDGSMITPFPINGGIRWGTKMGITGVSMQAENFVATHPEYENLALLCALSHVTPIFEWCSNQQRIVIDQPVDRLVLLHLRDNGDGRYWTRRGVENLGKRFNIPVVKSFSFSGLKLNEITSIVRSQEGTEGIVICFDDGHMVKVKSDWYVSLHRVKASIEKERDVARLVVTDKTDDLTPLLSKEDGDRLVEYTSAVSADIIRFVRRIVKTFDTIRDCGTSRKDFAQGSLACSLGFFGPAHQAACFAVWDQRADPNLFSLVLDWARNFIARNSLSNTAFNERARQVLSTARWEERTY